MIYFGEETGECGMDEEGFSGKDGRTTIFDWWSISSIRRLREAIRSGAYKSSDKGKLIESGMLEEEAEIFCRFSSAIRYAASDTAVRKGTTYDLCYCNISSDGFDKDRHFMFLRDHEDHTILFVANFSQTPASIKAVIPEHAFEWMGIPITEDLYPGKVIDVEVPPMDGVAITLI